MPLIVCQTECVGDPILKTAADGKNMFCFECSIIHLREIMASCTVFGSVLPHNFLLMVFRFGPEVLQVSYGIHICMRVLFKSLCMVQYRVCLKFV